MWCMRPGHNGTVKCTKTKTSNSTDEETTLRLLKAWAKLGERPDLLTKEAHFDAFDTLLGDLKRGIPETCWAEARAQCHCPQFCRQRFKCIRR